jgi:hypothetical protein
MRTLRDRTLGGVPTIPQLTLRYLMLRRVPPRSTANIRRGNLLRGMHDIARWDARTVDRARARGRRERGLLMLHRDNRIYYAGVGKDDAGKGQA